VSGVWTKAIGKVEQVAAAADCQQIVTLAVTDS